MEMQRGREDKRKSDHKNCQVHKVLPLKYKNILKGRAKVKKGKTVTHIETKLLPD